MRASNKIFLKGISKLEQKHSPLILGVIKHARSSFISDLQTHGKDAALRNLSAAFYNEELQNVLIAIYKKAGLFGAMLTWSELKKASGQKAASLGRNEQWIRDVIDYLRLHLVRLVSAISETMREDIVKILEKGVSEGWSIDETVTELRRLDLMQARARVIARTETVRAANVGHSVAAQSTPFEVDKKWNAANDHRTRHSHKSVNGHTTSEDGLFKVAIYKGKQVVGYDEMLYPGDATAHKENTINCRCRVTYLPKRDANGKLVMRKPNQARIIPLRNTTTTTLPAHQIAAALKAHIFIGIKP